MPRPTPAQLAYGSVTVVSSTLAMLLLSGVTSGAGVMVIAVAALASGLLVALTAPLARTALGSRGRATAPAATAPTASTAAAATAAPAAARTADDGPSARVRHGRPAGVRPQVSSARR